MYKTVVALVRAGPISIVADLENDPPSVESDEYDDSARA